MPDKVNGQDPFFTYEASEIGRLGFVGGKGILISQQEGTPLNLAAGVGVANGSASVLGVSRSVIRTIGSSSGVSLPAAVGAVRLAATGQSASFASVSGVGRVDLATSTIGVGSAAGQATVSGMGRLDLRATGESSANASVSGIAASLTRAVGSSSGSASVSGVGSIQAVALPTFEASQVFTPDPTNTQTLVSNDTSVTRKTTGICAYPHVLDVTGMADFDGVTNTAGERLNWLMYGSTDHAAGGIFLYCGFGSFATGTWKTYEDALADGDLSAYADTTPSVTGNLLYTTANEPETPFIWKEGSTWYLISHEVGPNGQWSRYATSTSAFGPFTDQGRFLKEDDTSNHNGYARFFEIPPQADVKGPIATGNTGDLLAVSLNRNAVSAFPNNAVHVVKRDISDTQMVTVTPIWREGTYPTEHLLGGDDLLVSRIQWVEWTDHGEMAALAMTTSDQSVFSNVIVEVATANDMYTYTREPKVVLQPQEITPPDLTGVQDLVNPNIITDTDGQKYLVIGARKNDRTDLYVVYMPVTVDTAAQLTAPRVYEDHRFEAIDISDYAAVSDIPAPWSIQDTDGGALTTTISNGRLELINRNSLAHAGFDPSTTEWAAFWADGSYQDQSLNNESAWTAYIIGAEKGFFGSPLAAMIFRQGAQPEIVRDDGGTVRETLTPTYSSIYGWPGGWEWDVTNQTVRPLHGDKTHHRTYSLSSVQNSTLTGQQMYPAIWQIVDQGLQNMSVGSMYVRLKGPAHTPNAAPAVFSAATDASGSKVTVTLDRPCLGRFGFVTVVSNTVVNTTPNRVDATTIDLVRDTGAFGESDDIRLYYASGGDVRSNPEWVLLPEITDSPVTNNVSVSNSVLSVGSASGSASVSGVGASSVRSVGSASGSASVSGIGSISAPAWTPADLFSATDSGFAFDLIDLSGANTLANQTGTTPGAGDSLGYLPGISPNAKTATQSTLTERPVVQVDANGQNYLAFDSTDVLSTTEDMSNDTWTFWMVYEPDGGNFITLSRPNEPFPWVVIGQQSSTNTGLITGTGIDSFQYWYDNTLFTGSTRGQSWTEAQAANLVIAEATTDTTAWSEAGIGNYNDTGSFGTPGRVYAWGAINRTLTSTERADLLAYAGYVRGV